uniref:Protein kinase domain-containing protein n=2 Tax=Rhodosorus marinus TaxID=101924 RepID=A0A7S3A7H3_9RHOD|mmetsp:Transcript_6175/g.26084  ORF Transcript_6175/g.26084 Transcript_6175/m.26084 type:complete len:796 (+) Transcript_6175:432-2819(+)|eukprot:CAMPEP_0113961074 /NCGR_PEP_ID=MMETSP0011_2-20120614/5091_1 /TAXON_ID=101924 /ORGANISM="Rhodosorus marinus" /LENGTH=795 /DNA_ID=CAMNT_0000972643 /DNA_START=367 /DNA_END=2754 /DNA_ORIENTATION=- /assembly_acc=CAM_ASM_000156
MEEFEEVDPTGRYKRRARVLNSQTARTVYKAFDEVNALDVSWNKFDVGQYSDLDVRRTQNEMDILENLYHKNIMNTMSSWVAYEGDHATNINIITELMRSGTLQNFLNNATSINMKVLRRWGSNMLQALAYMHGRHPPIIHRDLKCDNVFLNGPKGEVKIGDWGLSRLRESQKAFQVIDSPELSAPDLYREKHTEKVDIYAFGMCLLQMVSMEYPYSECENSAMVLRKVWQGVKPLALLRMKDSEVKKIVYRCLSPEDERPSAQELLMHPFFRDWKEDKGTGTNIELMGSKVQETILRELTLAPDDVTIGHLVVHNVQAMDRDVVISKSIPDAEEGLLEQENYSPPPPPIGDEKGAIRISVHVPLEGMIKKVEFMFDLTEDSVEEIANEMQAEFKMDDDHAMSVQEEIQMQIDVYRTNLLKRPSAEGEREGSTLSNSPVLSTASVSSISLAPANRPVSLTTGEILPQEKSSASEDERPATPKRLVISEREPLLFRLCIGLMKSCKEGDSASVLKELDRGASPNFSDYDMRTPLHLAVEEDHPETVAILLERGARYDRKDRWGQSPLRAAVKLQRNEILEIFKKNGVDAAELVAFDPDESSSRELLAFCANGSLPEVRQSLMGGAFVNCSDELNRTPLHYASAKGDTEISELLLLNGGDFTAKDLKGHTPVDVAVERKHENLVKLFKSYGALAGSKNEPVVKNPIPKSLTMDALGTVPNISVAKIDDGPDAQHGRVRSADHIPGENGDDEEYKILHPAFKPRGRVLTQSPSVNLPLPATIVSLEDLRKHSATLADK